MTVVPVDFAATWELWNDIRTFSTPDTYRSLADVTYLQGFKAQKQRGEVDVEVRVQMVNTTVEQALLTNTALIRVDAEVRCWAAASDPTKPNITTLAWLVGDVWRAIVTNPERNGKARTTTVDSINYLNPEDNEGFMEAILRVSMQVQSLYNAPILDPVNVGAGAPDAGDAVAQAETLAAVLSFEEMAEQPLTGDSAYQASVSEGVIYATDTDGSILLDSEEKPVPFTDTDPTEDVP